MTEKERMLAGRPYDSRDPELLGRYHEVRKLLRQYNQAPSTDRKQKRTILASLFGHIGQDIWIESPFFCDYGEQISFGNNVFVNYNCVFLDSNVITIGDNVMLGPSVHIYCATHPLKARYRIRTTQAKELRQTFYRTQSKKVSIGSNAWIGGGAQLMPGVEIGAGSVVTRSMPQNCFAAGSPCKVIRELD